MDAEAKSDPMEGNMHRNIKLVLQNLQVPLSLSKYTIEQFRECTECTTILLCLIALKIVRLVKKCIGHKMQIFLHSSCFKHFLLQSIFSMSHPMSRGIHVGLHVKCLSVTSDFN